MLKKVPGSDKFTVQLFPNLSSKKMENRKPSLFLIVKPTN